MKDNTKIFFIFVVILFFIYSFFFSIKRVHFICNENVCKIEQLNALGKLRNTIDVDWSKIRDFDTNLKIISHLVDRRISSSRNNFRYFVVARLDNGSVIDFFGVTGRDEYKVRKVVNNLRKYLKQTAPLDIDITYP